MKIENKYLKIQGYKYSLDTNKTDENIGDYGMVSFTNLEIQIASNISVEQKLSILIHEFLEILNYHFKLNLEHRTITLLAVGLFQILVDNGIDLSNLLKDDKFEMNEDMKRKILGG